MDAVKLTRVRKLFESGAARAIRESAGLSYTEAAASADVDRVTIHRWEKGQRRPHGDAAIRYLALLDELAGVGSLLALLVLTFASIFVADRWYTPSEVWRGSHSARAQVYEDLENGRLKGIRRGRRWLIPGSSVIAWFGKGAIDASNGRADNEGSRPREALREP
jgi:DNA-binding XRE family transcriptional regulator